MTVASLLLCGYGFFGKDVGSTHQNTGFICHESEEWLQPDVSVARNFADWWLSYAMDYSVNYDKSNRYAILWMQPDCGQKFLNEIWNPKYTTLKSGMHYTTSKSWVIDYTQPKSVTVRTVGLLSGNGTGSASRAIFLDLVVSRNTTGYRIKAYQLIGDPDAVKLTEFIRTTQSKASSQAVSAAQGQLADPQ